MVKKRPHPKPTSKRGRRVARDRSNKRVKWMKIFTDPSRRRN